MRKFSEIIRELREDRYTQQELANKLGVSKSTIGMWETDKRLPSKEVYEHIADLFNVDIDYLYGRTDIKRRRIFDEHGEEYVNNYYFNDETKQIAQEIYDNKDLKILFDVARDAKPDTLKDYAEFLKKLKDNE